MFRNARIFLLAFASAALPVFAQNSGEITGTVSDATSAVVNNASVVITNTETKQARTVTTNSTGNYSAPYLNPGIYDVTARQSGFKVDARRGLQIEVGATVRIDFTLQVGDVSQEIEVTGSAPLVDTDDAAMGAVIENKSIVELPLNGRNFLGLVALGANVSVEAGVTAQEATFQGGVRSTVGFNITGMRSQFSHFVLDGIDNTDLNFNSYIFQPSVDALQEFKVQDGIYSAEFGRNVTQITGSTKSGSNQFHATAFEFLRNSDLDAKQWLQQGAKNPFRRNQFGGVFSGPLIRNKVFFISNYEGLRDYLTSQELASVPTARMYAGDFSCDQGGTCKGSPRLIYDPATRVIGSDANGNPIALSATPFPGNAIPMSRFDQLVVQKLLPLMARASIPGDTFLNNLVVQSKRPLTQDEFTQRIDWTQNSNSSWFGRYSWETDYQGDQSAFPTSIGHVDTTAEQIVLTNIRMLGPSMVNEARFGLNIFKNDRVGYYANKENISATLGIAGLPPKPPLAWGMPSFNLSNGITSGLGSSDPFVARDTTFQWMDNLSLVRGKHSLKVGGEIRRDRFDLLGTQFTHSTFGLTGQATWNPVNPNATGFGMADLLLGQIDGIQYAYGLANVNLRSTSFAGYFQDDWKVTPKLTLNLGVRYENSRPWSDKYCGMMNVQMFDPGVGPNGILPAGQTQVPIVTRPCTSGNFYQGMNFHFADNVPIQTGNQALGHSLYAPDNNDFAHRIGVAYSPGTGWTFRSGFGAFYARDIGNTIFDMGRNVGGRGQFAASTAIPNSPIESPWQSQEGAGNGCSNWAGLCSVQPLIFGLPYNTRTPYVLEYLATIQKQLTQNVLVELGYVGNEGHKLQGQGLYNQALPRTGPSDASTPAQRRPWPNEGVIDMYESGFNSNYNGLSARAQQHLAKGLVYTTAFTWSKSIDESGGSRPAGGDILIPKNNYVLLASTRALSAFNPAARFVASLVYELPFGAGNRFGSNLGVVSKIIGGWQLSSIITFVSGLPVSAGGIGDTLNLNSNNANQPNATGISPFLANPTQYQFWNIAAIDATCTCLSYQYGNIGRNVLRAPGTENWDASVSRFFRIHEAHTLQFRFEAFNAGNIVNWNAPSAAAQTPSTFGVVTTAQTMRQLQVALKYSF